MSTKKIVLIIILLVAVSTTAYVIIVVIPTRLAERTYEGAKRIGDDIRKFFQFTPEVTVNNTIVLQQQTSILELATVSQKFQHRYVWANTWIGSTKKINIEGTFEAKAGFDLNKKFSIKITDNKAIVYLPSPKLLSVELLGDLKFNDEQGVWNWVSPQDRSNAVNAFQQDARKYATQAEFVLQAKVNMQKKLSEILKQHGKQMEIHFDEEPAVEVLKSE